MLDKNKAVVCCLLVTSAIMLSEKKKRKRKMWSKKWYLVGFTLSQATKALRESTDIALLYFRSLH